MEKGEKKQLILEGLDCANCAAKIEASVGKLDAVLHASMHFPTRTLFIETLPDSDMSAVLRQTSHVILTLEPDVVIREKTGLSATGAANKAGAADTAGAANTAGAADTAGASDKAGAANAVDASDAGNPGLPGSGEYVRLGLGVLLFLVGIAFHFNGRVEFGLFLVSYLLIGGEVVWQAVRNILRGQVFDENFLMGVATVGAFAIGQYPEGVAVMLFYKIGEFFQKMAVNHSRKSIAGLMDIRPDYANLKTGDNLTRVSPDQVAIGGIILVKPGEKVPLDGRVLSGYSLLDSSAITGESLPKEVGPGDEILSGTINRNGLLTIEVTKGFGESTVSKILDLVQNASMHKAPTENFITKFARYYTPAVVFIALGLAVIPPILLGDGSFSSWIYRALIFLVVSCPCALVISIPLFGGIGGASKHGILMKGSNYLEALNAVDMIVFDKTGTLTKGVFSVTKIHDGSGTGGKELLETAAYAECHSTHPIAASILNAYGKEPDRRLIESHEELSGYGTKVVVGGREICVGNASLMKMVGIGYPEPDEIGTLVHVAIDGAYAGYLLISDEIKEDSASAIRLLKEMGIRRIVMLTGDNQATGDRIGNLLGVDAVYANLLPHQKVEQLELLQNQRTGRAKIAFVGDGINDAPVLSRADVGIAMGGLGSDAAIEAADIVLMTDEPMKIVSAIRIARKTRQVVWQNIAFAFGVKGLVLLLGAGGLATMWEAVFADIGVALIAIFNAIRVLHVKHV